MTHDDEEDYLVLGTLTEGKRESYGCISQVNSSELTSVTSAATKGPA